MREVEVQDLVREVAAGDYNIPEFQRQFEWKYEQVAMLCDSLLKDLPIGILSAWKTSQYNEPKGITPTGSKPQWMVDGQQRITSLCILAGKKPYWMNNREWGEIFHARRIYLNIQENGEALIGRLVKKARVRIPLDELLYKSASETHDYVEERCQEFNIRQSKPACDLAVDALPLMKRSIPVAEIGDDKKVEDVAELYRRINQKGTKIKEPQIMLSYVAQYNRTWVRDKFYAFLDALKEDWELDPAQVLQVATILAEGKARVGQATIPEMWKEKVVQIWPAMKDAIQDCILRLWEEGITDVDMIPSTYTMIMLLSIHSKFMRTSNYDFKRVLRWFILANLAARYSDAPLEQLTYDGRNVYEASSLNEVLQNLLIDIDWTEEELRKKLDDPFRDNSPQALLLHILLWSSGARDWLQNISLPALTQTSGTLESQWHHILPKDWGKRHGFEDCEKTGNLTRLCGETNVRKLKKMPPWEYVPQFNITEDALSDHLIPKIYSEKFIRGQPLSHDEFKQFVRERQEIITKQGASYLDLKSLKNQG
ncbi:MAG: DUF262 domain-containing protein [Chloroflexi bacterium]|nr:DUF262 domain-containing protein [Chloroflexota bacterium]